MVHKYLKAVGTCLTETNISTIFKGISAIHPSVERGSINMSLEISTENFYMQLL